MKVAILFNCQHLGLANAMRALRPDLEVLSFELVLFKSDEAQEQLFAQLQGADTIIGPYLGPEWGRLGVHSLREKGFKILPLLGIGFSGYHPDTVYVHTATSHYQGATGPYHSRIAIAGFLGGLSVRETVGLFNKLVYSRLGYLDAFQQARVFIVEQFRAANIDLAPYIDAWASTGCFMHSLNHPKIRVLCDLAVITCEKLGLDLPKDLSFLDMVTDNLSIHPQMPVYPEVGEAAGTKGYTLFKAVRPNGAYKFLTLQEYVTASFDAYETGSRDMMAKASGVADAMKKLDLNIANVEQA